MEASVVRPCGNVLHHTVHWKWLRDNKYETRSTTYDLTKVVRMGKSFSQLHTNASINSHSLISVSF